MWAVTCIALKNGAPYQELSYFTKEHIEEGSVITILLRGKEAYGLVLDCKPVTDLRQNIRASSFALQKIKNPKPHTPFSRAFLRAAFEASMSLACSPGALIAAFVPNAILEGRTALPEAPAPKERGGGSAYEPLLFSHERGERVSEYKRLVREGLARGRSLLIITPTIAEAETLGEILRGGIPGYVEVVHGALTKKKLLERWARALTAPHPVVIIGTLLALSLPRPDIATIILEREGSTAYNRDERPYTQGKVVAEALAKTLGVRFILASTVPSVESYMRKVEEGVQDLGLSTSRLPGREPEIIDLREHKKGKGGYDPLTPELIARIGSFVSDRKPVLVLAARRGLAPLTCCDDCGEALRCATCSSTLVFHKNGGPKFLCHHCGEEESASVRCRKCGGWRLTTLGIAIDGVALSLERHFTHTPLYVVSSDTKLKEEKAIAAWQEKGGILLSTERILPYLPHEVPCIAIASIDSFLSIPEYTASERAYTLLAELKSRAAETFVIQTRDPAHRVMRSIRENNLSAFYKDELKDRKQFHYPPYTTLVRITLSGKKEVVEKEIRSITKALDHLQPTLLTARADKRAPLRTHILLRLPQGAWVDQRLLRFIRTLPQHIEVRINPTTLHSA